MTDPHTRLVLGRTTLPTLLSPSVAALLAHHGDRLAGIEAEHNEVRDEFEAALADWQQRHRESMSTPHPIPLTDAPTITFAPFDRERDVVWADVFEEVRAIGVDRAAGAVVADLEMVVQPLQDISALDLAAGAAKIEGDVARALSSLGWWDLVCSMESSDRMPGIWPAGPTIPAIELATAVGHEARLLRHAPLRSKV